jgi:hypothetical protein
VPDLEEACVRQALSIASRNHVQGSLIRFYGDQLPDETERWNAWCAAFRRNLLEAASCLEMAGLAPVLIKAEMDDYAYGNFDVLIGEDDWEKAVEALRAAHWRLSRWFLEPDKILASPGEEPSVHLHKCISWFGIPIIPAGRVRRRCLQGERFPMAVPERVDSLRIWLAHAAFQSLHFDLSELLALRPLLVEDLVGSARHEALAEGWSAAFDLTLNTATDAIRRLDQGEQQPLPTRLPIGGSLRVGLDHAAHLFASGHPVLATREAVLRPALVARKLARRQLGGAT